MAPVIPTSPPHYVKLTKIEIKMVASFSRAIGQATSLQGPCKEALCPGVLPNSGLSERVKSSQDQLPTSPGVGVQQTEELSSLIYTLPHTKPAQKIKFCS